MTEIMKKKRHTCLPVIHVVSSITAEGILPLMYSIAEVMTHNWTPSPKTAGLEGLDEDGIDDEEIVNERENMKSKGAMKGKKEHGKKGKKETSGRRPEKKPIDVPDDQKYPIPKRGPEKDYAAK
jgi:hypothetical protein